MAAAAGSVLVGLWLKQALGLLLALSTVQGHNFM